MKYIKSLLILTSLLFGYSSHATHLMGGEIVAQQISGYQYQILMTVYRDTAEFQCKPRPSSTSPIQQGRMLRPNYTL